MDNEINTDNMDHVSHTINRYKKDFQSLAVGDNFESQVFKKIKRKKTERKIIASTGFILIICTVLFIARGIVFHKGAGFGGEEQTTVAVNDQGSSSNINMKHTGENNSITEPEPDIKPKEEVPVMGEVIFSSSDHSTNYAVQQVSYTEDRGAI